MSDAIAIVHYRVSCLGMECWFWGLCKNPKTFIKDVDAERSNTKLLKRNAMEYVKSYNLLLVHKDNDGEIYASEAWVNRYRGIFSSK